MSPEVAALVAVAAARARLIVSGWLPVEMAVPETASGYSER
jgi:hypothetical protein